jgi:N-acetylglucosamine-6-phosphate deacetylase
MIIHTNLFRIAKMMIIIILLMLHINEMSAQQVIEGIHYYTGQPVQIEVEDGMISEVRQANEFSGTKDVYIAPGFFDNQVNGFAGVSFSFGGSDLTIEGVEKATRELWKKGVTTYLPTLTTNSQDILVNNFSILAGAVEKEELLGSIPGFHLEGPYINPEDGYRGAHPRRYVRLPDWNEFMEMYEASGEKILQVTVAPEMEGALDFITRCGQNNILVALGHHNAPAATVTAAIDRGARIATHLGNGTANTINRHLNPFWSQLSDDRFMISIICDGFHLLPEEINTFYKVKGPEMTVITSDVTHYAALEPGEYKTGTGETIELTDEGMLRYPAQNVLYGSASPITKGVGHIIEVTGCTLAEAVKMASTNPAQLYGLNDRGMLVPGKRADIVLFRLEDFRVNILKTYVKGKLVYSAD